MTTLRMHQIEVDEEVYNLLKQKAEPFKNPPDTPNGVLRKLLFAKREITERDRASISQFPSIHSEALNQTLQMIVLVKKGKLSRVEAAHQIAKDRGVRYQTVISKYTTQLGKDAEEIDYLLMDNNLGEFQSLLKDKFPRYAESIEKVFKDFN